MIIRKEFKYEMAHIVRKAWTRRCSKNIHGHSYLVELLMEGNTPDQAQMLLDFGIIKTVMKDFVDSFDHSFLLWNIPEDSEIIEFAIENFERVIITPFSSSAEMQAKMFADVASVFLHYIKKEFSEHCPEDVEIFGARVHETKTGWGEYNKTSNFGVKTLYPIEVFDPGEADTVITNPKAIYISDQIAKERSQDISSIYNTILKEKHSIGNFTK